MKRGYLIFNPTAGVRRKSKAVVAGVIREFERHGIDITPSPTEPEGSVMRQVRELLADSPDLLVAWGGDGTINEVLNGMFGSDIPLGVISGGTANILARELRIPRNIPSAVSVIASGKEKRVSVGQANNRYFLLMAGVGFDGEVIKNVDWNLKQRVGKIAWGLSAVSSGVKYTFPVFKIRANGQERDAVFAVICNAKGYAAYFILAPEADISDEYFQICVFKEPSAISLIRYFLHAWIQSGRPGNSVEILKAKEVEVTGSNDIAVQVDGELIGYLPMKFQIHPGALRLIVP